MSNRNLFIDSAIKTGITKMSSENGIENLGVFRMKEKFVTVIWTTAVVASTELHYGNTEGVEKVYTSNKMTTKHQAEIMVDSMDDVKYIMAKSITQDGTEFKTDVKASADYLTDLGGNVPVFNDTTTENTDQTSLSDVSLMSYMEDNGVNHSFSTAQQVTQGIVFGTAEQGVGSDYYKILLTAGKTYSIDLIGMVQGEDYDLYLYNSSQSMIKFSNIGSNFDESMDYTPTVTGTYYLKVMPYTISSTSPHHNYELMTYFQDCPPDSYEPNDGKKAATPITAGNTISATLNVIYDEDWFAFDTTKTGKLNVTLKSIPSDCDYDLEVYRDDGITLIDGSYSSLSYDEKITRLIDTPGRYYIRVYHASGANPSDTYELQANVYTPDSYELNDDAYSVMYSGNPSLDLGSCTSATIDNPDDTDFFKFTIGSSTNVGVRLQNIPAGTDYELVLYSYNSSTNTFSQISSSTYGGNSDETVVSQLAAGSYYIKMYPYSGSSETQSYKLSVTDDSVGIVKIDFDKMAAPVGDIIAATLKVDKISNFAGYQVNLKYDPEVIQPVDDNLQPYSTSTKPISGSILINSDYSPFSYAVNDIQKGILNFSTGYIDLLNYRNAGIAEISGTLAIIKFKVLKENQIQIKLENSDSMPGNTSGVYVYDWDGNRIFGGYTVQQPQVINSSLPINPQAVESSSVVENKGMAVLGDTQYKVCGYIKPDLESSYKEFKAGFNVKIAVGASTFSAITNQDGYFEILGVQSTSDCTIKITKDNYLKRVISNITLNSDIMIGKEDSPVLMWAGDLLIKDAQGNIVTQQDNAINMTDIMTLAKCFNSSFGGERYVKDYDLDLDGAINMADIMNVAKHFCKSTENYDKVIPQFLFSYSYVTISAGVTHVVALKADGTVWTWGINLSGKLGVGTSISSSCVPVQVSTLTDMNPIKAIAAGNNHTLALKGDGTVWAWGENYYGQLGDSSFSERSMPF